MPQNTKLGDKIPLSQPLHLQQTNCCENQKKFCRHEEELQEIMPLMKKDREGGRRMAKNLKDQSAAKCWSKKFLERFPCNAKKKFLHKIPDKIYSDFIWSVPF